MTSGFSCCRIAAGQLILSAMSEVKGHLFGWEQQHILGMKDSGAKTQSKTGGYLFLVGPRVSVHTVRRLLQNKGIAGHRPCTCLRRTLFIMIMEDMLEYEPPTTVS